MSWILSLIKVQKKYRRHQEINENPLLFVCLYLKDKKQSRKMMYLLQKTFDTSSFVSFNQKQERDMPNFIVNVVSVG